MIVDVTQLTEFRQRYGHALGMSLCAFYEIWKQHGEDVAKTLVPNSTFYRYRKLLEQDGYLDIKQYNPRRWIR